MIVQDLKNYTSDLEELENNPYLMEVVMDGIDRSTNESVELHTNLFDYFAMIGGRRCI